MVQGGRPSAFKLKVKAKYKILDANERFKIPKMRDFSLEGIYFESEEMLGENAYVFLEVDPENEEAPFTLAGQIHHSKKEEPVEFEATKYDIKDSDGKRKFLNSIRLESILEDDLDRFLKYYCDKIIRILSSCLKM